MYKEIVGVKLIEGEFTNELKERGTTWKKSIWNFYCDSF